MLISRHVDLRNLLEKKHCSPPTDMFLWSFLPISLSLVSFIGTWTIYGLAYSNQHVCSLNDWTGEHFCKGNLTSGCCKVPTLSTSGTYAPENSLFTATINASSFLFLLFVIFHHAHILEKHACYSMMSKLALIFGVVASFGAFAAGNCNPGSLPLLHYVGAAISFLCICFYTVLLTALTSRCHLSGYETVLYPTRIILTVLQTIATICYTFFFAHHEYHYVHMSAVSEWFLSVNLELFELSYAVEFCFFSSYMISNLYSQRDEDRPFVLTMS
ncbi:transmembrane protein 150A isoform X1 [Nerophis ophidion]|uniref:transmembrane protein 150A isoform X1 n=2 Tax=Nerophis ophidion TaxID=159077 RepID=UPI002AE02155|nr:transmembrane protein 150A isoform X1 [Nerophis ophidion]